MRKISIFLIMLLALSSLVLGASIIQVRRDTAANWVSSNPILAQGEMGLETDTLKLKFGNGTGTWNALPYYSTDLFDPSGYYTSIQIDSQNLTMTEFVLYVNSTNDAGNDYNDAWINTTIDTKDIVVNTSMKNYVDNLNGTWEDSSSNLTEQNIADFGFLKFLNLTSYITNLNTSWVDTLIDNRVVQSFVQTLGFYTKDEVYNTTEIDTLGNWSADKIDYSTTVLIQGWIDGNYTALDGKIDSIENLTLAQIVTNIGNWSDDKGDYYTSSEVDSIITTMDNLSLLQIVTNIGNWSEDKTDYSTTTEANLLYAPTGYGDEWNKTYADTLYLTSYENLTDADILALGYNHTADLTAYFNTLYSNSTDTNETTRVDTLVNQVASMENLSTSDVQGIKVDNATYADDSALLGGELPSVYLDNTDYCSDGSCGSLIITGNFTIIGGYINATVENQFINGSIIPELDNNFNLGSQSKRWDNIYTTNIESNDWANITITENQISDLQDYLTSYQNLTDEDILAFGYNHTTDLTAYFNTLYSNDTDTDTNYSDSWINDTIDAKDVTANTSIKDYTDNLNGTWQDNSDNLTGADVIEMVGNFSAWDQTWINTTIDSKDVTANTSIKDYTDNLNGTWQDNSDNLTEQNIADFGFLKLVNITVGIIQALGFYTTDEVYNTTEIDNLNSTWDADELDGEDGTYYLDDTTISNCSGLNDCDNIIYKNNLSTINDDLGLLNQTQIESYNGTWEDNSDNLTDEDILALGYNHTTDLTTYYNTLYSNDTDTDTNYSDSWINGTIETRIDNKDYLNKTEVEDYNGTWDADELDGEDGTYYLDNTDTYVNATCPVGEVFESINGTIYGCVALPDYDDDWINTTTNTSIIDKVNIANISMKDYADTTFLTSYENLTGSDVISMVGNWSEDKPDYSTTIIIKGWIDSNYTELDGKISSMDNLTLDEIVANIGNWTDISGNYYTSTQVNTIIDSMDNLTLTEIVIGIGNWSNDKQHYYNITEIDNLNGTWEDLDTIYSDDWINTTIDTKDVTANTSIKDYTDNLNGTWQDNSGNLTDEDILAFGYNHTTDLTAYFNTLYSNDTDTDTNYSDSWINTTIDSKDVTANTSMKDYTDNLNGTWLDNSDNLTEQNIADFGFLKLVNITVGIIQALGFYTTDEVYNTTEIDNLNGTWEDLDTIYSDSWINTTIDSKDVTANTSMKDYTDNLNGTWLDNSDNLTDADILALGYNHTTDLTTYYNNLYNDTTYTAGNGITLTSTAFSVVGGTALTQDAGGLSVTDGGIGDTQIADAYINQALTTTSDVTHADVTVNNITSVNCIYFDSGGKICSGS